ncbi:MAG: hypothetical protein LH632_01625 [Rhodoferax sp.]|nr:hypothetical protein [Rhodoferax sp.]
MTADRQVHEYPPVVFAVEKAAYMHMAGKAIHGRCAAHANDYAPVDRQKQSPRGAPFEMVVTKGVVYVAKVSQRKVGLAATLPCFPAGLAGAGAVELDSAKGGQQP